MTLNLDSKIPEGPMADKWNNYIANQVFLEIGAQTLGGPVSLEKSLKVANEILAEHDLVEAIQLQEGSGISRDTRFTARGLATVLHLFESHSGLLKGGRGSKYKTGTMSGIRTLAGYADTAKHGRVRFVIALKTSAYWQHIFWKPSAANWAVNRLR